MHDDENTSRINLQSVGFYNEIAGSYNNMLEQEGTNEIVRKKVAQIFLYHVKSGRVLDFGGGTGLDLDWMSLANYSIFFCEPSNEMRNQAIRHNNEDLHYEDIVFLDETLTDFSKWKNEPPFINRVDGILANFAVFNSIYNVELLFKNLGKVIKPGGHLFATVLSYSLWKSLKKDFRGCVRSLVTGSAFHFIVRFNQHQQSVYLHTPYALRKASSNSFAWHNLEPIFGSKFSLLHLMRK